MSMASTEALCLERHGAVAVLTLNRPDTRNALSGEDMFAAFENHFAALDRDLGVGAIVLTGAGSAFCSGGNVADMRDRTGMFAGTPAEIAERYRTGIQRIPRAFERLGVPIIAAVNGPAIGAGNDLACMCDIRIASESAVFAESFIKVGIVPGDGGCWLLPRTVGASHAAELAFTGKTIDAAQALAMGLVSRVVPPQALMEQALSLAAQIAANSPQILRWTKQLMREARVSTLGQALDAAAQLQGQAHHTEEHAEAVRAFFEKRTPVFGRQGAA